MTITLHTKNNYVFWASKNTDSELLLRHINGGERWVHGDVHLNDIKKLADAHGWKFHIRQIQDGSSIVTG